MPKSKRDLPENEWSFFVKVEDVSDRPEVFSLEADEELRAALARRFNIPSIESLCAQATVSPVAGAFHVTGHLKAKIVQSCIVTAEPVTSEIEEDFEGWFADRSQTISFAAAKKSAKYKRRIRRSRFWMKAKIRSRLSVAGLIWESWRPSIYPWRFLLIRVRKVRVMTMAMKRRAPARRRRYAKIPSKR